MMVGWPGPDADNYGTTPDNIFYRPSAESDRHHDHQDQQRDVTQFRGKLFGHGGFMDATNE